MPLYLSENDVKQLPLSIEAAIPIMEETLLNSATGLVENGARTRMPGRGGFMQVGPAALHRRARRAAITCTAWRPASCSRSSTPT